jgi:ARG and Rhodanese-Phosphatase-superfamily-associated Protein domain
LQRKHSAAASCAGLSALPAILGRYWAKRRAKIFLQGLVVRPFKEMDPPRPFRHVSARPWRWRMMKVCKYLTAFVLLVVGVPLSAQFIRSRPVRPPEGKGIAQFRDSWRVLEPITRRNLTIFPVVSNLKVDTSGFLTLDDGMASGSVKIGERGQLENAMYRPRNPRDSQPWEERRQVYDGASVNELVLVNNSSRPLILLAGEVVSGGKQNRIIGADMVVPPKSDPLPLTVFCVEHGRWTSGAGGFGSAQLVAQPSIRKEAQVSRSQSGVWNSVAESSQAVGAASPTSSYVDAFNSPKAKRDLEEVSSSIQTEYERELREQIRDRGAVGVVVAIDGQLVWSDVFSSPDLFRKYWPKLLRSYVMEAEGHGYYSKQVPSSKDAQAFLFEDHGHETVHEEPDAYRRTQISGADYDIVALEALGKFEDNGLLIHFNKMSRD